VVPSTHSSTAPGGSGQASAHLPVSVAHGQGPRRDPPGCPVCCSESTLRTTSSAAGARRPDLVNGCPPAGPIQNCQPETGAHSFQELASAAHSSRTCSGSSRSSARAAQAWIKPCTFSFVLPVTAALALAMATSPS